VRFLMTKEMEQAIIPTLEEDIRTRFILEVDAKQRKFLGTFELKDAVNFCIEIVKEEQSKQSALLSQELKERDEEWNKYTDMHDDVMLDQIDELEDRLKEVIMTDKPVAKTPDVREALRKVVMCGSCLYIESGDCPVEQNPACKQCDDLMDRIYSKVIQPLIEAAELRGIDTAITAYESTCEALIQEAKTEERARIIKEIESHALQGKNSFSKTTLWQGDIEISPRYDWWQALKKGMLNKS